MDNVTAKPFIGPDPNWSNIKAATKVVAFESMIALRAFSNPLFTEALRGLPLASSSLILSFIRTLASTILGSFWPMAVVVL